MNYIYFLLQNSLSDLRRNKIRTILTSLGILIGVLSVVLLIAFGLGLKNYIQNQFNSLGTNLVFVTPGKIISGGGFRGGGSSLGGIRFDEKDVLRLKRIKEAEYVVPVYSKSLTLTVAGKSEIADLYATTADWFVTRKFEAKFGRLFTRADVEKRAKIIVIGPKIAGKLFADPNSAVGKSVRVENQSFRVIGVVKEKGGGGFGGPDLDSFIYMPYKSAYSFNPDKKFVAIYMQARFEKDIPQLKVNIGKSLLKRYKEDDFSVLEQTEILNIITSIFSILNSVLIAIGSISLVVGGVGIMNIMYASVTERTKEIGIRRAIGATKQDILLQFLTEALLLSVFGGLLGLILAYAIVFAIQSLFPAEINLLAVTIALGVSSLIGIFFGVFPARRAANLSPIEAIRYE